MNPNSEGIPPPVKESPWTILSLGSSQKQTQKPKQKSRPKKQPEHLQREMRESPSKPPPEQTPAIKKKNSPKKPLETQLRLPKRVGARRPSLERFGPIGIYPVNQTAK